MFHLADWAPGNFQAANDDNFTSYPDFFSSNHRITDRIFTKLVVVIAKEPRCPSPPATEAIHALVEARLLQACKERQAFAMTHF
jgi:hypothetical protein